MRKQREDRRTAERIATREEIAGRGPVADRLAAIPDPGTRAAVAHALGFGGKIPRSAWFPNGEDGPFVWFEMTAQGQTQVSPDGIMWGDPSELPAGDWSVTVGVSPDGSPFRAYRPGASP